MKLLLVALPVDPAHISAPEIDMQCQVIRGGPPSRVMAAAHTPPYSCLGEQSSACYETLFSSPQLDLPHSHPFWIDALRGSHPNMIKPPLCPLAKKMEIYRLPDLHLNANVAGFAWNHGNEEH